MHTLNTINKQEIKKFSLLAQEWWNPYGKFKPLHKFNPTRIEFIRKNVISHFKLTNRYNAPLKNLNILDIGCGGGLLSEPMARMGANVTGIDASQENINVAKIHAKEMGIKINYIKNSPEKLNIKNKFDVVLNMEVIEHVSNLDLFISSCSKILKKNSMMFIATINRTLKSYLQTIIAAEYILKWLPIGTHDWNRFLTPKELEKLSFKYNLIYKNSTGVKFNLFSGKWEKSKNIDVNYISIYIKN